MKEDYIFYTTDESFDFGDWFWSGTHYETGYHGFSIDFDGNDNPDITTLEAFGDYSTEIGEIKTLEGLKDYIISHLDEVQEINSESYISNKDTFIELIEIIKEKLNVAQSN